MEQDQFFTIKEFAEILKISTKTVHKLIRNNEIKAFRVTHGKRCIWRIYAKEIDRMMAEDWEKDDNPYPNHALSMATDPPSIVTTACSRPTACSAFGLPICTSLDQCPWTIFTIC